MKTELERFSEKIQLDEITGCWNWTAFCDRKGYGVFSSSIGDRAIRWSHSFFNGPLDDKLVVDHMCRNRRCVCPTHLRLVTNKVNADHNRNKTHCPKGHPLTPDNCYFKEWSHQKVNGTMIGGIGRQCRTCTKDQANARYARLKIEKAVSH